MDLDIKLFTVLLLVTAFNVSAQERLRLATTTSTDNTGLLAVLHSPFEEKYNVKVDVIAVGTGKALKLGEHGDADVLLVHAPAAEIQFLADGHGKARLPVMHNDFVILGPPSDPAGLNLSRSVDDAMSRLAAGQQDFISRGDDSGTHKKEMSLWQRINKAPDGKWYLAAGQGMGAVIRMANDKLAYTLADRGTYLAFRDKIDLVIVFDGDALLFNPYHVLIVNDTKHPHLKTGLANQYAAFIRGPEGQAIIGAFKIEGEQLFYPDVIKQ